MPDPIVMGSLISAGASLLGGSISDSRNRRLAREQMAMQREFAQHGIRWRVEDAKAAGLHPLYALGAQVPSYSPLYSQSAMGPALAEAGQSIGRAVAATSTPMERELARIQLETAKAAMREGDARAGLLESDLARRRAEDGIPLVDPVSGFKSFPVNVQDAVMGEQGDLSPYKLEFGGDQTVSNPGVAPGFWTQFKWSASGPAVLLPGGTNGDPAEALESLAESPILMWMTYQENRARHGKAFTEAFFRRYFGNPASDFGSLLKRRFNEAMDGRVSPWSIR